MEDGVFVQVVRDAVSTLDVTPADGATVGLAIRYAEQIDADPEAVHQIGPKLLACLDALLMTPKSRAAVMKNANPETEQPRSPLDELRQRRQRRAG